jgi:hypothetical protein
MEAFKNRKKSGARPAAVGLQSHTHSYIVAEITGHTENVGITTFVERIPTDNRRCYRDEIVVDPPSPHKRQRAERDRAAGTTITADYDADEDFLTGRYEMGFDADDEAPEPRARGPRIVKPSVCPGIMFNGVAVKGGLFSGPRSPPIPRTPRLLWRQYAVTRRLPKR